MTNQPGTIYLLHFEAGLESRPGVFSRHYLGWTLDAERRVAEHVAGQGSPLVAAVVDTGQRVELARTWDGTRNDERRLKNSKNLPRHCPVCKAASTNPNQHKELYA